MRWPWRRPREELAPRQAYDLWAPSYGEPPNALQKIEHEHLFEMLPPVSGLRVLDLGCGRGRVVEKLRGEGPESVLGLDLSLGMLARWRAPGVPRLAADLAQLPLRNGGFDVVICALVLAHLPGLDRLLVAISSLLRPGGVLVVSDFHPKATSKGWQRTFTPAGSERELAVRHHPHTLDDYRRGLSEVGEAGEAKETHQAQQAGWHLEEIREPRWKGVPVLLLMRWRRPLADKGS